jgi:hypothetical protein
LPVLVSLLQLRCGDDELVPEVRRRLGVSHPVKRDWLVLTAPVQCAGCPGWFVQAYDFANKVVRIVPARDTDRTIYVPLCPKNT